MKWFRETILESEHVKLVPINHSHKNFLLEASKDGDLNDLWFTSVPHTTNIDFYIDKALNDFKNDKGLAFVIYDKKNNKIIGSTRFTNAIPEHKRVEIGYTWYAKSYQKTHFNSACKLLMLTYAFETLKAIAVEFRTHWYNFESRNAILRLGAKQDGVLRNHQILEDGTIRDTVVFSIIENEWKSCKKALEYRIEKNLKRNTLL